MSELRWPHVQPSRRVIEHDTPITLGLGAVEVTLTPVTLAELARLLTPYLPVEEPPESSPYLTVAEAAVYLRSSRQRVYDLVSSRRLPRHKDGSRVLIRRSDLVAYLNHPADRA